MSKLIPPLLSTTPPPIGPADVEDNEDDEFGDFAAAEDTTYGCDSFSIPNTPEDSPRKTPIFNTTSIDDDKVQVPCELQAQGTPIILQDEEKTKDYQDKRKNVENDESHVANGIIVPNVPIISVFNNSLTNGHSCDETRDNSATNGKCDDDDDTERPPQLFDDDSEEKEEVSETPSNFSMSFEDNVIDDDDEEDVSENMPIELPNHVHDIEIDDCFENLHKIEEKLVETCKNIQEFDDFDDEFKQAEEIVPKFEDTFENCEDSNNLCNGNEKEEDGVKVISNDDDFGNFNTFASIPSIPTTQTEETVQTLAVSCDIQSNSNESNKYVHKTPENHEPAFKNNEESEKDVEEYVDAKQENSDVDVDFDDFQFTQHVENSVQTVEQSEEVRDHDDDFDDFADFSSAPIEFPQETSQKTEENAPVVRTTSVEQDGDDDFGDFGDYTTSTSATTVPSVSAVPLLTQDKVYEETQMIFKVMFEPVVVEDGEYKYTDATTQSAIFDKIKDVTDAHALSYQWGKSQVQQGLLKALNIDTRNMLHAHGMPMPKFAANLGVQPLEPVKSGILTPTLAPVAASGGMMAPLTPLTPSNCSVSTPAPPGGSVTQPNGDIPAAQFDWNASGLANPLDSNQSSTLFDLEQLAASLSLPTTTTCAVGVDRNHANSKSSIDEDWDLWLQSVSKEELKPIPNDVKLEDTTTLSKPRTHDSESVNSLQFPEMADVEEPKSDALESGEDFSDFTSFQYNPASSFPPQTQRAVDSSVNWSSTSNMIPLRETYIADVKSDWSDTGMRMGTSRNNHSRKSSYEKVEKPEMKVGEEVSSWLQPTILTPVLPHKALPATEEPSSKSDEPSSNAGEDDADDFDDFQDFQTSSVPPPVAQKVETKLSEVPKTSTEVMNAFGGSLLSPTVLQPTLLEPVKLSSPWVEPQAILWPDPGITDEELARFDLYAKKDGNYSQSSSVSLTTVTHEPVVKLTPTDPNPSSTNVSKAPETKMSGPGGSLMVEKHVVVPANKVILPFNEVLLPPNNQVVISKDLVLPILESSPRKYTPQQKPSRKPASTVPQVAPPSAHDEDDWCDFVYTQPATTAPGVSGSTVSPSKHTLTSTPTTTTANTTSTPELSLSIPQLRSMQSMQPPSKTPIPVITPRGLVQTKIPTMAPSTPAKSLPQTALHVQPPVDGYQPAIISTQFAAHLNMNAVRVNQSPFSDFLHNGHYQTTTIPVNNQPASAISNGRVSHAAPQTKLNGLHDDDEWSDFMSSQPVNTGNHSLYTPTAGLATLHAGSLATMAPPASLGSGVHAHAPMQIRSDWNRIGYASDLPNIITNPVHFQSYPTMNTPANVLNKKPSATNGILHSKNNKKAQNLNVARLPDLDFVAPKAKVYHNNKK